MTERENPKSEIIKPPLNPSTEASAKEEVAVSISADSPGIRSIVRTALIASITVLIVLKLDTIAALLSNLLFLLILSVFIAYLMDPLVKLIRWPFKQRAKERLMPRALAIVIAYIIVFSIVGAVITAIAPGVVQQARDFGSNLPAYSDSIQRRLNDINRSFDRLKIPEEVQTRINDQAKAFGERITTGVGSIVLGTFTFLPWLVIIPILSFFFLKDVNVFRLSVLKLLPAGSIRERADAVLADANRMMAAYVRAQIISCLLIGTICTIGFYLLGMRYALLLGILAGVLEFIPLLGPLTIGIIATITAALGDYPPRAFSVAIFLIVLRIIHDYVTYPKIVRGGIHLHPVLIIICVLAGEQIAGIPGVFLAIPVVALITVVYKHYLEFHKSDSLFDNPGQEIEVK
jgi:predicted PurR-regulated permease PerM